MVSTEKSAWIQIYSDGISIRPYPFLIRLPLSIPFRFSTRPRSPPPSNPPPLVVPRRYSFSRESGTLPSRNQPRLARLSPSEVIPVILSQADLKSVKRVPRKRRKGAFFSRDSAKDSGARRAIATARSLSNIRIYVRFPKRRTCSLPRARSLSVPPRRYRIIYHHIRD